MVICSITYYFKTWSRPAYLKENWCSCISRTIFCIIFSITRKRLIERHNKSRWKWYQRWIDAYGKTLTYYSQFCVIISKINTIKLKNLIALISRCRLKNNITNTYAFKSMLSENINRSRTQYLVYTLINIKLNCILILTQHVTSHSYNRPISPFR